MRVLLAMALLATAGSAAHVRADPAAGHDVRVAAALPDTGDTDLAVGAKAAPARATRDARHAIYVELGGRAGLWGLGYDWQPHRRFAVGAAASYTSFDGDRITTFAPYVAAYPILRGRHRGFVQLGPTVSRQTTPSPFPEWDGLSTTKLSVEAAGGYEYRHGVLVRGYVMASKGAHLVPWIGASIGWTL